MRRQAKSVSPGDVSRCAKYLIVEAHERSSLRLPRNSIQARQTRSVAASLAFHLGKPLPDVLRAAGWSAPNSFINHYLMQDELIANRDVVAAGSAIRVLAPPATSLNSAN